MIRNLLIFLLFSGASAFVYWRLIPARWRRVFLLLCSLIFVGSFSFFYTIYFLFDIVAVYIAGTFIRSGRKHNKSILQIMLFWLVGNLLFLKYINLFLTENFRFVFLPQIVFPEILLPIGVSYLTFRLIHYIVDVYRGEISNDSFAGLALYILFFPTFLAGPVERFQSFHKQALEEKGVDISGINYGLWRILLGVIRKVIIADSLMKLITPVFLSPDAYPRYLLIGAIYALAIQIYMDFAGYTDIAIGVARLFGYKIMENFNRPFLQKNIAFFWRNWHISVYSWIRDYFFFPVFGYRASNLKIYLGLVVTMVVFMLWHRGNINFLILGIYYGLGLVLWYVFQEIKRKYPALRDFFPKKYADPVAIFSTFTFVSVGFLLFSLNIDRVKAVLLSLFKI